MAKEVVRSVKKLGNIIGGWAFLIGVVLALLFGVFGSLNQTGLLILVIIGIIIGLFNIADAEASPFMFSGIVLIIASALGQGLFISVAESIDPLMMGLENTLRALLAIFVPATIIVAIRNSFILAKN